MKLHTPSGEPKAVEDLVASVRDAGARLVLAPESDVFIVDWRASGAPLGEPAVERDLLNHYDAILDLLRRERDAGQADLFASNPKGRGYG
jgi:hypothetical protein